MRTFFVATPFALAWALALTTAAPSRATAADLSACGPFDFSAGINCELKFSGGCETACTPLNVAATCDATCEGSCTAKLDVGCSVDCNVGCEGECKVDPGKFDCTASCNADCSGSCDTKCASSGNKTQCKSTCSSTCSGQCSAKCEVVPPSATCKAKCTASCDGSCTAEANIDCRVDCEGGCQVDVSGGCKTQCAKPEGALFCNGQYVDSDDLGACIAALATIEVTVSGSAECDNGVCTAEGEVSCAASPLATTGKGSMLALGSVVAGLAVAVGRRRRRL